MYIKQFHQFRLAQTVPSVSCNTIILSNSVQKPCDNSCDGMYFFISLDRVHLKHFYYGKDTEKKC